MSNDLTFLNNYTEVILENVTSIIKQNFVFQTQLKMSELKSAQLDDAKKVADELTVKNRELQSKVTELTNLTASYKNVTDDKTRLQVSLNETSQSKNQLQSQLNDMQQELTRLRNQSVQFEELKKENAQLKTKIEELETTEVPDVAVIATKKTSKIKTATAGTF
jgi:DNA repair exonuclease SbcCD ATPase subunit